MLIHFIAPHGKLFQRLLALEQVLHNIPPIVSTQQHPGPCAPHYGIPAEEWPNVVRRVSDNRESLRQVAADYGVSHETVRRVLRTPDRKERDKPLSSPCLSLKKLDERGDHSCWNSIHHLFLNPARSWSPTRSSAKSLRVQLASGTPALASSSRTVCLSRNMTVMLGRRHRNSVAEEGGRNTGRTWTEDGKRRQYYSHTKGIWLDPGS